MGGDPHWLAYFSSLLSQDTETYGVKRFHGLPSNQNHILQMRISTTKLAGILLFALSLASQKSNSQSIASSIAVSSGCPTSTISVSYTATGSFNEGNVFTVQLSDGSGFFTSPISIGTVTATTSGSIAATIPSNTVAGTSYRVRVVSSDPVVTGTQTSSKLVVNNMGSIGQPASQVICHATNTAAVNFTGAVSGSTYSWTNNNTALGLASSGTGNISAFMGTNAGTAAVTATVTVTSSEAAPAVYAYIPQTNGQLAIVNMATNSTTTNISASLGSQPMGMAVSPDGTRLYVGDQLGGSVSIINTATSAHVGTISGVGSGLLGLAVSADGTRLYVAVHNFNYVKVINLTDNSTVTTIAAVGPTGLTLSSDGAKLYVANENGHKISIINTATNAVLSNFETGVNPVGIALSPDGTKAYVTNYNSNGQVSGTVTVLNLATGTIITTIPIGNSAYGISITPDGSKLYVTNEEDGTVAVVSTTTNTVASTISLGSSTFPYGISITPDGTRVIVSCWGVENAFVINTTTNAVTSVSVPNGSLGIGNFIATKPGTCSDSKTFTIIVNPSPSLNLVNSQALCVGSQFSAINFTGSMGTAATYSWTNSNTSIGLASSGTGNIAAFTATNPFNSVQSSTMVATSSYTANGKTCIGGTRNFTMSVNPKPTVSTVTSQALCGGSATSAINFTNNSSGGTVTYQWTNDAASIGLSSSGTGNISSFTTINNTGVPIIANLSATATMSAFSVNCAGIPRTFTITVKPKPDVVPVASFSACSGSPVAAVSFSGNAPGTVFSWANNNTATGIPSSGLAAIDAFTATNTIASAIQSTVTVTPSLNGCTGTASNFVFTANSLPVAGITPSGIASFCSGSSVTLSSTGTGSRRWLLDGSPINNAIATDYAASVAGIYAVQLTSAQGCVGQSSNKLVSENTPSITALLLNSSVSGPQCAGTNILLSQTGGSLGTGAHWQWYSDALFTQAIGGQLVSANAAITVSPAASATYYLRAEGTTAPCSATASDNSVFVTVEIQPGTVAGSLPPGQSICANSLPSDLVLSGSTGSVSQWQSASDEAFTQNISTYSSGTILQGTAIGLLPGSRWFRAVVSSGGCTTAYSNAVLITVNSMPQVFGLSQGGSFCNGLGLPVSLLQSETGISYQLLRGGTPQGSPQSGTGAAMSFGVQGAGSYTVLGTTSFGCANLMLDAATIVDLGTFTAQIAANQNILCESGSATTITISGGPANGNVLVETNGSGAQLFQLNAAGFYSFSTGNLTTNTTYSITAVSNGQCTSPVRISTTVYVSALATDPAPSPVLCAGTRVMPIPFTGNFPAGTTFTWTAPNGTSIGLPANTGTGTELPEFIAVANGASAQSSDIRVVPNIAAAGCKIAVMVFRITVKPTPSVNAMADQLVCAGNATSVNFNGAIAGTVYSWTNSNTSIGLYAAGLGDIPSFATTNNSANSLISGTITVTPYIGTCAGNPSAFTISVRRSLVSFGYPGSPYCQGGVAQVQITGSTGGTFAAFSGGLALNASSGEISLGNSQPGTYLISYAVSDAFGCGGYAVSSVTILPKAVVNGVTNQALCAGATMASLPFSGNAQSYLWICSNTVIGLPASGTGNLPSFVAQNNTSQPISAQINIYPQGATASTCTGQPMAFRILVYPKPSVSSFAAPAYCRGVLTSAITFTSATPATTFTWTNSNTTIGLNATRGIGAFPSFIAQNINAPASGIVSSANILVVPTANKCVGTAYPFTITVNDCITQHGSGHGDEAAAKTASGLQISPNPVRSTMMVLLPVSKGAIYSVQVVSETGIAVTRPVSATGSQQAIDLSALRPGIYVLQVVHTKTGFVLRSPFVKL
jgi:YVTN family beta-propeller protein